MLVENTGTTIGVAYSQKMQMIFWTDAAKDAIFSANMDGTNRKIIAKEGTKSFLSIHSSCKSISTLNSILRRVDLQVPNFKALMISWLSVKHVYISVRTSGCGKRGRRKW